LRAGPPSREGLTQTQQCQISLPLSGETKPIGNFIRMVLKRQQDKKWRFVSVFEKEETVVSVRTSIKMIGIVAKKLRDNRIDTSNGRLLKTFRDF